jgi:Fe-S oxidoreductase
MNISDMLDWQRTCVSSDPPPCGYVCPLGINIPDFIKKLRSGLAAAAYRTYSTDAVLCGIACHICNEPCKERCVRSDVDEAVSLRDMERYCWQQSLLSPRQSFHIPGKHKKVLVVGGGLTGTVCAIKMAQRGYATDLIEREDCLVPRLRNKAADILPVEAIEADMATILSLKYLNIRLCEEFSGGSFDEYDAILIATGQDEHTFDMEKTCTDATSENGIFFAEVLESPDNGPVYSIAQGKKMSYLLENYIKIGRMDRLNMDKGEPSRYHFDTSKLTRSEKTAPVNTDKWTLEEVKLEASRCELCQCHNCSDVCPMLAYYGNTAKRFIENVSDTVNKTLLNKKIALHAIMSCNECGLCKTVCPVDIDLGALCNESKRILTMRNHFPREHYDYWLKDMAHSNGDEASIYIPPIDNPKYVYFPGCQLGASDPEYVLRSYAWLNERFPRETAMVINCCGAPAYWSGDSALHKSALEGLRSRLKDGGAAKLILACSTCKEMFRRFLPEVETVSLWTLMEGAFTPKQKKNGQVAVFDPCSSRVGGAERSSVRSLMTHMGFNVVDLDYDGIGTPCCGYGGLIYSSAPEIFNGIAESNAVRSDLEYVVYCANCRDVFAGRSKPCRHILDLLLFDDASECERSCRPPVNLTERRRNRIRLNRMLRHRYLGEKSQECFATFNNDDSIHLLLSEETSAAMHKQLILEDDIKNVIMNAEYTKRKTYSQQDGFFTAYERLGYVTYWVQYRVLKSGYEILDVYTHRARIEDGK